MAGWMIPNDDPARIAIAKRALEIEIKGDPDKAAHELGQFRLVNGQDVNGFVVHAADAIIEDGRQIVMINRKNEPGMGKLCLPGGFLDSIPGFGVESTVQAAAREAKEEVGIDLDQGQGQLIGTRNMYRPFDVRIARIHMTQYGIKSGDIFMVSTQAVRFYVDNLERYNPVAGDDALPGSARKVEITSLTSDTVGIPDHFDMIAQAFPELFPQPAIGK
jgi:ADP-ribose pyrophosphatase YjhB (NUDIX family)